MNFIQVNYAKRIFGLDLMRAVAILMVVSSHVVWILPDLRSFFPELLSVFGALGVEIFFVLSGFLIGRILYNLFVQREFTVKTMFYFWIRRWFRTLPNYYFVLLVNIAILYYLGNSLPEHLWRYFFFVQNLFTEMPWFFPESWSLSIEEFAYIIGPLLLYMFLYFLKCNISRQRLFLLVTLLILVMFLMTRFFYHHHETVRNMQHWNVNVKAIVLYRIDAIYYGVLAAYLSMVRPKLWFKARYGSFGLGILIFLVMMAVLPIKRIYIETHPAFWNVWYFVILSLAIALTLPLLATVQTAPKVVSKPITYISLLSYSMYLLHYSVVMQLLKFFIPSEQFSGIDMVVYLMVYLLMVFLSSYLLYVCFEKPMMDLRDKPVIKNRFK